MNDLWPEIQFNNESEVNNTIPILREQARVIEKKTNGVIKATFSKITYKKNSLSELSKVASALSGIGGILEEDDLLIDRTDINTLYQIERYKFEIYSDTYKFRIFTVENRTVFPVFIIVDEGICSEIGCKQKEEINNNHELEELVSSIFHSNKIKTILSRMLEAEPKQAIE